MIAHQQEQTVETTHHRDLVTTLVGSPVPAQNSSVQDHSVALARAEGSSCQRGVG
jgi:hypothetical protein